MKIIKHLALEDYQKVFLFLIVIIFYEPEIQECF